MRMILILLASVVFRAVQEHSESLRFTETMFTRTMILLLWEHLKLPTPTQENTLIPQLVSQFINNNDYQLSDPVVLITAICPSLCSMG